MSNRIVMSDINEQLEILNKMRGKPASTWRGGADGKPVANVGVIFCEHTDAGYRLGVLANDNGAVTWLTPFYSPSRGVYLQIKAMIAVMDYDRKGK